MDNVTHRDTARNRAALYHWFALAFFQAPSAQAVADMREGNTKVLLKSLEATPGASSGIAAMRKVLAGGEPLRAASALGAAHARLFDGVGGYEMAPPYRSVYDSKDSLLCQEATAEMDRALRQHRLKLEDKVCEPADHLSIQLDAMAQLALRVAEEAEHKARALPPLLAEQADFLDKQLLSWVRRFAQRLVAVDALGFYAGLASVLVAVLEQDRAYLAEN
jgi:TorA-specific chaperone